MASITDHIIKLQELTQKNLEILQALNDSFFTNQNHLSVSVGENHYAIPSFISLENKINSLTANFENLVNAPKTGEAFFDFNGNTRAINVRTYTSTPNSLVLNPVTDFNVDKNDIFKDFLTPLPYINLEVPSLPNDITQVLVKKVIPLNSELKSLFKSYLVDQGKTGNIYKSSIQYDYKDLYKIIDLYKQDVDYIEYDTKLDLPIRKNIGSGTYVIEEIIEDIVDENLDNFITIKFRTDVVDSTIMSSLKYRLFDETIEKMLMVGDQLVTFEGNAKMEIVGIQPVNNSVKVKVLYGEFLNLVPATSNDISYISPLSKINFYSPIDFNEDKIVKIPLEEDQFIFVAVAALNSRMNVQSPWGTGLMLNTYALKNKNEDFKTYYDENVRNVGDVLYEMTALMSNTIMKYSKEEYDEFTQYEPMIDGSDKNSLHFEVVRINEHLNNSPTVKNIRALHNKKSELKVQLEDKQNTIDELNDVLSRISFDDVTGMRQTYVTQLEALTAEKNNIFNSLQKISNEISSLANNSETPIDNAKYRIRGYFDTTGIKYEDHIKGIRVQYRYKNIELERSHAITIGGKFVFSDWNEMQSTDRERIPIYKNGTYLSELIPKNDNLNEPSFNQIDIPITQGESVDIRIKLVYDFGAPFISTTSKWSNIKNIKFPEEFLKDVKILDIIEENNNDIETSRFTNIINEEGIPTHINDKITDQDVTYFHKPENISSGFYTAERRIIPLKDKLLEMNNIIQQLKDELYNDISESLIVSIKNGKQATQLVKDGLTNIKLVDYKKVQNLKEFNGYKLNEDTNIVSSVFYISILNDSDHVAKLYSLFPGNPNNVLMNKLYSSSLGNPNNVLINPIGRATKYNAEYYGVDATETILSDAIGTKVTKLINYENGIWMEYSNPIEFNKPYKTTISNSQDYVSALTNWPFPENLEIGTIVPGTNWDRSELDKMTTENKYIAPQTYNQFLYFNKYSNISSKKLYDYNEILELKISTSLNSEEDATEILYNHIDNFSSGYILSFGEPEDAGEPRIGLTNLAYGKLKMNPWMGIKYYSSSPAETTDLYVYPKLTSADGLRITNGQNYITIQPKEEFLIPIVVEYYVNPQEFNGVEKSIEKTMSFDIATSQYKDPTNYEVKFCAKYDSPVSEQLIEEANNSADNKYNIVYR